MDISSNKTAGGLFATGSDKVKRTVRKCVNKETDDGHSVSGFSTLRKQKILNRKIGRIKEWKSIK
jgi:hypothetical protein